MVMGGSEARQAFVEAGAVLSGHFQLTSGRHSDTYIQCARVLEDTQLTTRMAGELAERFDGEGVDLVAAPAVGGLIIGFAVAQALGVPFIFSERQDGAMRLRRGFAVPLAARVLLVEDVVTTGGSVAELEDLVTDAGGEVIGIASLIDRGGDKVFSAPLQALLTVEAASWDPTECEMCAAGQPVDSPGSRRL